MLGVTVNSTSPMGIVVNSVTYAGDGTFVDVSAIGSISTASAAEPGTLTPTFTSVTITNDLIVGGTVWADTYNIVCFENTVVCDNNIVVTDGTGLA